VSQKCSGKPSRRWENVKKMSSKPRRPPIPNCTRPKVGQSVITRSLRVSDNKDKTLKDYPPAQTPAITFSAMDFPAVELTPAPLVKPKVQIVPKVHSRPEPFSAKLVSEHMKRVNELPCSPGPLPLIMAPSSRLPSLHKMGTKKQLLKNLPLKEKSVALKNSPRERSTSRSTSNPAEFRGEGERESVSHKVVPIAPVTNAEDCCNLRTPVEKNHLSPLPYESDGARSDMRRTTRDRLNHEKRNVKVLDFHRVRPRANKLNKPSPKPRECMYSRQQLTQSRNRRSSTASTASTTSLISEAQSPITGTEYQASESSTITTVILDRGEKQERQQTNEQPNFGYYLEEERSLLDWQDPRSYLRFSQSVDGLQLERQMNGLPFGMLPYPEPCGLMPSPIMSIPNQYAATPVMYPLNVPTPLFQGVQLPLYPQLSQPLMPYIQYVQPGTYVHPAAFFQYTGFYQPNNMNVTQTNDNVIQHSLKFPGV